MKLIDKTKTKQFGILLIIIGTFIPLILYPFTSLTAEAMSLKVALLNERVLYDTNFRDLEVVLVKGAWKPPENNYKGYFEGRIAIPYRYTLAFGILLAFSGIGIVCSSISK